MNSMPQQPSPEDVNDILKRKRKVREHKVWWQCARQDGAAASFLACYPCRKRKVRCDSHVPCKTCVERQHPELCTFNPPNKRRDSGSPIQERNTANGSEGAPGKDDWERISAKLYGVERALAELKDDLRQINGVPPYPPESVTQSLNVSVQEQNTPSGPGYVKAMEMQEHSQLTGDTIHLGGGSVPALINALGKGNDYSKKFQSVFGNTPLLPVFGLDNESATYPFVSLWGSQEASLRVADLRKILPNDAECTETFRQYKEGAHVLYPAIANIETFESDLLAFLANRRNNDTDLQVQISHDGMDGRSVRWIGLLFAVLGSGCQYTNLQKRDRELMSQVYTCCSFECLRLANYLSNASIEIVQTLLILGNILSNSMNAGASWVLLGMTLRLARTLGADTASEHAGRSQADLLASKTWWAVLWQDSLLCISYDRATSTATPETPFPTPDLRTDRGGLAYAECMYRIAKVGLLTVRNRIAPQSIESRLSRCVDLRRDIAQTREAAADHLRDQRSCKTIRDQVEYWVLHLHASYMTSELCRPAISPGTADFDRGATLRRLCIANLLNTVEAFNGIANASPLHARAWSVLHRALSAALLLGILGEPLRNSRAHDVIRQLIKIMKEGSAAQKNGGGLEEEMSAPVARSISALSKLSAPESITPRVMEDDKQAPGNVPTSMPMSMPQQQGSINTTQPYIHMMPGTADLSATRSTVDMKGGIVSPGSSGQTLPADGPNSGFGGNGAQTFPDIDESAFYLPTPLAGFEDGSSPYALMDSIIWGGSGGPGALNGRKDFS